MVGLCKRKRRFKLSPLEDPHLQLVVAINFLPGFLVGSGSRRFRNLLRQRVDVVCVIHCTWLLTSKGRNMRRPKETIDDDTWDNALIELRDYLREDKERAKFLHTHWADLFNWQYVNWEEENLDDNDTWLTRQDQFKIVLDSYLKHGLPMEVSLRNYIEMTRRLFEKVMVIEYFQQDPVIRYPLRYDCYYTLTTDMKVRSQNKRPLAFRTSSFVSALSRGYGKKAQMCFQ